MGVGVVQSTATKHLLSRARCFSSQSRSWRVALSLNCSDQIKYCFRRWQRILGEVCRSRSLSRSPDHSLAAPSPRVSPTHFPSSSLFSTLFLFAASSLVRFFRIAVPLFFDSLFSCADTLLPAPEELPHFLRLLDSRFTMCLFDPDQHLSG